MRKIILAMGLGLGITLIGTSAAEARIIHHRAHMYHHYAHVWHHHYYRHYYRPYYSASPYYFGSSCDDPYYDPYCGPGYDPYYAQPYFPAPGLFFGFGFGGHHFGGHHWHH